MDDQIRVHYKNYSDKWDEWLHKSSSKWVDRVGRIAEVGKFSEGFGFAKFHKDRISRYEK